MNQIDTLRETCGTRSGECQRLVDGADAEDRDLTDAERKSSTIRSSSPTQVDERLADIAGRRRGCRAVRPRVPACRDRGPDRRSNPGRPGDYRGGNLTREAIRRVEDMRDGVRRREARARRR